MQLFSEAARDAYDSVYGLPEYVKSATFMEVAGDVALKHALILTPVLLDLEQTLVEVRAVVQQGGKHD